jgi:hypothetical protein
MPGNEDSPSSARPDSRPGSGQGGCGGGGGGNGQGWTHGWWNGWMPGNEDSPSSAVPLGGPGGSPPGLTPLPSPPMPPGVSPPWIQPVPLDGEGENPNNGEFSNDYEGVFVWMPDADDSPPADDGIQDHIESELSRLELKKAREGLTASEEAYRRALRYEARERGGYPRQAEVVPPQPRSALGQLWDAFVSGIEEGAGNIGDATLALGEGIVNFFKDPQKAISDFAQAFGEGFWMLWNDPKGTLKNAWDNIRKDPSKALAELGVNLLFLFGSRVGKGKAPTPPVESPKPPLSGGGVATVEGDASLAGKGGFKPPEASPPLPIDGKPVEIGPGIDPPAAKPTPKPPEPGTSKGLDPAATRPKLRKSTKEQARAAAKKTPDGDYIDPYTGKIIPKEGPFDYGHPPGDEWWRLRDKARAEGWTREQVIEAENGKKFQIEDPSSNRGHQHEKPK